MALYPSGGQFGGNWRNNPQMQQGRPWKWDPIKKTYVKPDIPATGGQGSGQAGQNPMQYWEDLLKTQFGGKPNTVKAPQMGQGFNTYLQSGATPVTSQNITAPQMSQDYMNYLNAGTQAINAAGLQDTGALLRSYDPILQQQQEQGFSQAAMRAGKTGMWGSPYAQALGAETAKASNQRATIANQYLYQASEQAANRQLQAEIQNRQNQLQAVAVVVEGAGDERRATH